MASLLRTPEYQVPAPVALRDATSLTARLKGTIFWDFPFCGRKHTRRCPRGPWTLCPAVQRAEKEMVLRSGLG